MAQMLRSVIVCVSLLLIQAVLSNADTFSFDTTHFAGSLHSFDVVDAIEYQKGFAVLVGSKKPFTIQGKDITRGFAVVLLDENMKMTRWVDAQYPTMVPVGITLGDDSGLIVIANMNGTINKRAVCGCAYADMVMMKDFNPFAFRYNNMLQCNGVVELNRRERHGETRPNGAGGQIAYCEAYSSAVLSRNNVRYHVGVARAGSWCYKSGENKLPYIWVRYGEDIEAGPHFKVLAGSANPTDDPADVPVFGEMRIDAADIRKIGTETILFAAANAEGKNMNLKDKEGGSIIVDGASFVFAAKIEKSELLWRHRYQAADNVDFSDVHLHHDFLITVASGKMSQVIIDVFNIASSTVGADPVAGSWSSSAIPASSDVTVHKVGKCVLAGENLYVPVYLDGKGSWAATSTFSVTTRDDHDVVILKFRVSNAGEVILDSTYQALPKPPADSSDWLHELAIAGSEGKLLGLSTQSVGAFAMELRAGLVVEQTTKKVTVNFKAPETCPSLPPREPPMAMYIPSTYAAGNDGGSTQVPKAAVPKTPTNGTYVDTREDAESSSGTSWAIMTIVLVILGIVLFVVYRRLQSRRAANSSGSPVYDKVAL